MFSPLVCVVMMVAIRHHGHHGSRKDSLNVGH